MVLQAHPTKKRTAKMVLQGNLTVATASTMRGQLLQAIEATDALTLDLSAVERIDLACLQLLFATQRSARNHAKTLQLTGIDNPALTRALQINGLDLIAG